MPPITASLLYALVECPHRVWLDAVEDPAKRDPTSPFVELLWERGSRFERETIERLKLPFLDQSGLSPAEKERETLAAMQRGAPLIYSGRISSGDLLGQPDLLKREGTGYVAGDIKSGAGEEGADEDDRKPKKHYAVQLALYTDILAQLGVSAGRRAFVWDVRGDQIDYDLEIPQGVRNPQTLWRFYETTVGDARRILAGHEKTLPAAASKCGLCHWNTSCREQVKETDDLSQIPELGRAKRDAMLIEIGTVEALAGINPAAFIKGGKTPFKGVGPASLKKFHDRAKLMKAPNARPYLTQPVRLPVSDRELHFDIEADPMRDHIYLHGFVVRDRGVATDRFEAFVAEQPTPPAPPPPVESKEETILLPEPEVAPPPPTPPVEARVEPLPAPAPTPAPQPAPAEKPSPEPPIEQGLKQAPTPPPPQPSQASPQPPPPPKPAEPEPKPKPMPQQQALATPPRPPPPAPKPELRPSPLATSPAKRPPSASTAEPPSQHTFVNPADTYARARVADNYLSQVLRKIVGYRYESKTNRRQGVTVVRIVIARDGRLLDATVISSSGEPEFDNGVLAGVRAGAPYTPLPDNIKGASAPFDLPLVSIRR